MGILGNALAGGAGDIPSRRRRLGFGLLAALAIAFILFPQTSVSPYWKTVVLGGFFWAIMSASWALLAGVAGQFSFAHMGFVAISTYSAGLLWEYGLRDQVQASDVTGIPSFLLSVALILFGALVTGVVGLIVGWLLLRLRSSYLALFTIAFSEVVRKIIVAEEKITGGMNGLSPRQLFDFGGSPEARLLERDAGYYMMFILLVVSLAVMYWLANSRIGLFLRSMREDEDAAAALGVNVVRYKILIFTFTSVIIGIAGGVFYSDVGAERITPDALRLLATSLLISYAVLGGMESMIAAAAGAFISRVLLEIFREVQYPFGIVIAGETSFEPGFWRYAVFGIVMILTLRYMRNGLLYPLMQWFQGRDVALRETVSIREERADEGGDD